MNKQQLITKIAEDAGISQENARKALNAMTQAVTDALVNGDKVQLVGFGTFKVNERKARKGRNPQTGKELEIPASRVPAFTAGSELKEAVNA